MAKVSSEVAKTSAILTTPSARTVITPRTYTEEEIQKIIALREYANSLRLPESDPYYPWESRWLAENGCAERYMRATRFKLEDAKKRVAATLQWRREYKPDLIPPEEVRIESETGKIILNGLDVNGRPIITMHPGRENTKPSDRQLRHLVYVLERAVDLMPEGQDSLVIIVDYRSATLRSNPSISVAAKVLHILQNHYPERLGRAIVVHLPFILQFFYKGISPFLDPVTRDKMRFNPDLKELIPDDHLHAEYDGSFNYEFEPNDYWQGLITACHIAPDGGRLQSHPMYNSLQKPESQTTVPGDVSEGRSTDNGKLNKSNVTAIPTLSENIDNSQSSSDDDDDERGESAIEPRTPANGLAANDVDVRIQTSPDTTSDRHFEMDSTDTKFNTEPLVKGRPDALTIEAIDGVSNSPIISSDK